jgi:hypothetical protein
MLSSAPTFTPGSAGNVYGPASLAANTSVTSNAFYVGVSGQSGAQGSTTTGSAVSGRLQVASTGGATVATTNGCQVQVLSSSDGGTTYDVVPYIGPFVIATVASTLESASYDLPPGQYKLKLTNLDTTNALTTVQATLGTTG